MVNEIKRWLQKPPVRCDVCSRGFTEKDQHFFDAKTKQGPWGLLCQQCWNLHGVGLGVGLGQKYSFKTLEQVSGGKAQDPEPMRAVTSLAELKALAEADQRYEKLICIGSSNLGGPSEGMEQCYRYLVNSAQETFEELLMVEVSACIPLVESQLANLETGAVSLKGVRSMPELRRLCRDHQEYQQVVITTSGRLAGPEGSFIQAWRWLTAVAMAGSESHVIKEVNECIRTLKQKES